MIVFNEPPYVPTCHEYMKDAIMNRHICGDGKYTKKCSQWIEKELEVNKVYLTTSCTHALEMAALLIDIKEGDEVIMPSFTFASTADAFAIRGARIIFVDIRPDTMNIDEKLIEEAITKKTKAIVAVHYAGVSCEMEVINEIAKKYGLYVIEDAAQAMMASFKGKSLGTWSDIGCISFHETKNFSMGEGGALYVNDSRYNQKAEILREKGTNRSQFWRGEVDKYTWVDLGSSYLPSELNAAYLWSQIETAYEITSRRLSIWTKYYDGLKKLHEEGKITLPYVPEGCIHNAHMFYIKTKDLDERSCLIKFLKSEGVHATFHYLPLHSAGAGIKYGSFRGEDRYTTKESERLLRLPMFNHLTDDEVSYVIKCIYKFYSK